MPFRIRPEMKEWFKYISPQMALQFDIYYLCLIAGLATRKKLDAPDATDLVNDFPGEYRSQGRIIVALFLACELREMGVSVQEKVALHTEINKRLDPTSSDHLKDLGTKEMNRYAFGGFAYLEEQFPDKPRSLEHFLVNYHRLIAAASDGNLS